MVTGTADTACTFQLAMTTGISFLLPSSDYVAYRFAGLTRRFDRAHPQSPGAPVLSEFTTLIRMGTI
jgi:hypothetical protein